MPTPRAQILIASANANERERAAASLTPAGCEIFSTEDGHAALLAIRNRRPDLALVSLELPGLDGLELCKELRRDPTTARTPVFLLCTQDNPTYRLLALELGADELLSLPMEPRELMLRVRNMIERTRPLAEPLAQLHFGKLVVDMSAHEVNVGGRRLKLSPIEFKLLTVLVQHSGHAQTRADLLREVWANAALATDRTVDTHIRRLRGKLGPLRSWIRTVRTTGYCFKPE
ncbi:MAG: response regulator transcription factor [Verrucomicrobia bacterium]|nr:response regulator transcription factor [Verrucomicrobiota bacterium]